MCGHLWTAVDSIFSLWLYFLGLVLGSNQDGATLLATVTDE